MSSPFGVSSAATRSTGAASILSLDRPRDYQPKEEEHSAERAHKPAHLHWVVFAVLVAFALLAAACGRIASPQGWAGPTLSDDGKTIYATIERGKIAALDANDGP